MSWKSYFFTEKITSLKSKFNQEIQIKEFFGKKTIIVDDAEQTGGTITGMWEKAFKKFSNFPIFQFSNKSLKNLPVKNCLVLGLGGGDVIRTLDKHYPGIKITCIEIDPVMKIIYEKFFQNPLKSSKSPPSIIIADAFQWVNKNHDQKFNLIVVDLYIGRNNPAGAGKILFLGKIKNLLTDQGYVLYNRHFDEAKPIDYRKFYRRCKNVFNHVECIVKYRYSRIIRLE